MSILALSQGEGSSSIHLTRAPSGLKDVGAIEPRAHCPALPPPEFYGERRRPVSINSSANSASSDRFCDATILPIAKLSGNNIVEAAGRSSAEHDCLQPAMRVLGYFGRPGRRVREVPARGPFR